MIVSIFQPIFHTTYGGQEFKMHGGTNQISENLANSIGREKVLLNQPVHYLEQLTQDGEQKVLLKTLSGDTFTARYVIMATPPAVQQKIHYVPPLPAMKNQLITRTPHGSVLKCIVYYETAFWRKNNMCGSLVIEGVDDQVFPITYTLDDTKPDGSHPAIIGFIPADKARTLIEKTKEERLKIITQCYAKAFGLEEAKKVSVCIYL